MILTVQILQIIFYSVGIVFMGTLILISIWGFITFNKMYKNQRIQNFLLDKIYQGISQLDFSSLYKAENNKNIEDTFDVDELINEDEVFNHNYSDDDKDNIT